MATAYRLRLLGSLPLMRSKARAYSHQGHGPRADQSVKGRSSPAAKWAARRPAQQPTALHSANSRVAAVDQLSQGRCEPVRIDVRRELGDETPFRPDQASIQRPRRSAAPPSGPLRVDQLERDLAARGRRRFSGNPRADRPVAGTAGTSVTRPTKAESRRTTAVACALMQARTARSRASTPRIGCFDRILRPMRDHHCQKYRKVRSWPHNRTKSGECRLISLSKEKICPFFHHVMSSTSMLTITKYRWQESPSYPTPMS